MSEHRLPAAFFSMLSLLIACGDSGGSGVGGGVGDGLGTIGGVGTTALVYVTNGGSDDVSGYTINTTSGALTRIGGASVVSVANPSAIAVSADGFFAFVANAGANNTVTSYRVTIDGNLLIVPSTPTNPNPAPVGMNPEALAIASDHRFLYVANKNSNTVTAFSIGDAGNLTLVPKTGSNTNPISVSGTVPEAMVISPDERFLFVANGGSNDIATFHIEANGLLTLVPQAGATANPVSVGGTGPKGITVLPAGKYLYSANAGSHNVTAFQIGGNGLLTLVPSAATLPNPISVNSTSPNGITTSLDGRFLYTANGGGNVTTFSIGSGGLLTLVPASGGTVNPIPAGTSPVALVPSPDGLFLFVANGGGTVSAYTISSASGGLNPVTPLLGNPFRAGTGPTAIATPGRT